ncbi:MAG: glycosyltransferase family 2 protein [Anaerolineales bacterium]
MSENSTNPLDGPSLSIVLPVYHERDLVGAVVGEIHELLQDLATDYEIIAVDDGSDDGSYEVLRDLMQTGHIPLKIARHLENRGNGAALRSGIRAASKDVVVTMDADGQHSPTDILKLIAEIPPYDLVIGARTSNYRGPWHRTMANGFYNWFASWLSGHRVLDLTSGFRAMRRKAVLHFLPLFPSGFSAPTTTTLSFLKAGYNVKFVPIEVGPRQAGESKIRIWRDGVAFFTLILRMIMLYDPLRIFLPMALVLAALGAFAAAAGMIQAGRLVLANSAIFLFISSLLTGLLGLVSGQISSTLVQYHGDETLMVEAGPELPKKAGSPRELD